MTITELKTAIANYFELANGVTDLIVNGQDLALLALNQVRRQAELMHDFEFSRQLVTVAVNGVTGGSLDAAVRYSDGSTAVAVKSVIEVGLFDDAGNLRPVEWTTVAESLERQRLDNKITMPRYVTDDWYDGTPLGLGRFDFTGSTVFRWPKDETITFTLGLEVYAFAVDWSATSNQVTVASVTGDTIFNSALYVQYGFRNSRAMFIRAKTDLFAATAIWYDSAGGKWVVSYSNYLFLSVSELVATGDWYFHLTSTSESPAGSYTASVAAGASPCVVTQATVDSTADVWTTYGHQYLLWGAIVHINHIFKRFVFRQEGNLPPPEKLRDEGLAAFVAWDAGRYEQNRRHNR